MTNKDTIYKNVLLKSLHYRSVRAVLVAVHDLRFTTSVRLRAGHTGQHRRRLAHPEPRAAQLRRQPCHLLHILQ